MTVLTNYNRFSGNHYETGSLHNVLMYQGVGLSEALLLSISGGIMTGYFSFNYEGFDPHVALLTRNTFDPLERILERLGISQDRRQTTSTSKAQANLKDILASGRPVLVWVDMYSLPYHIGLHDDDMHMMIPVVVYGYDNETVFVADRANVPFHVPADAFLKARGVVKKTRYQVLGIDDVNMGRLASAVEQGLHDTVGLFNGDVPVKPAAKSIGYHGMSRWADCLTQRGDRQSWQKVFPPGGSMYAGLITAFQSLDLKNGAGAERARFADSLDEAAQLLDRPALVKVANGFRQLAPLWTALAEAHLPTEITQFSETRQLLRQQHNLFIEQGQAAQEERVKIIARLREIRATMDDEFPLNLEQAAKLRQNLADQVLNLRDQEQEQIQALANALA